MTAADTVLLDVDGTLVDSSYHHALAWSRAFAAQGIHPEVWRIHRAIGMGGDTLVAHVADAAVEQRCGAALRELWEKEYAKLVDQVRAFDGAAELVGFLKEQGFKVALASSGKSDFTEKALEAMGLARKDFDAVTSSDDAENSKPAPDIFAVALSKAGGTGAIVVGDSTWDIRAARALGAPTVCVRTGGFGEDELLNAGAELVVDSVGELTHADWKKLAQAAAR